MAMLVFVDLFLIRCRLPRTMKCCAGLLVQMRTVIESVGSDRCMLSGNL